MKDQIAFTNGEGDEVVIAKGGANHGLDNRIQNCQESRYYR